jgi:magnesium transporter
MVVRALALGQIQLGDTYRIVGRELLIALAVGLVMGLAVLLRAEIMGVAPAVALVAFLAGFAIVVWAALMVAILPLVLHRLRIDPAVVSAPLITMLVDGTGLLLYLSLARKILGF